MSSLTSMVRGEGSVDDERLLSVLCRYVSRITARGLLESARREPEIVSLAGTDAGHNKLAQKLSSGVRLFTDEMTSAKVLRELLSLRSSSVFDTEPRTGTFGAEPRTGTFGAEPRTGTFGSEPRTGTFGAEPRTGTLGRSSFGAKERSSLSSNERPSSLGLGERSSFSSSERSTSPGLKGEIGGQSITLEIRRESDLAKARTAARDICQGLAVRPMTLQKVATIVSELARNMVSYAGGGMLSIKFQPVPRRVVIIRSTDNGPGIPNLDEIMSGRYQSRTGLGLGILGTKRLANGFQIESGPGGTMIEAEVVL